jgi:hypothetical protein
MGAGPVAQQAAAPRDLSAHDAALADVQAKATVWSDKVGASDSAREAYDAALAALNAALAEEATARTDYEASQLAYKDAYDAVPKEDSLAP